MAEQQEMLIKPEGYKTVGGVPRKAIAGVIVFVTTLILVVYYFSGEEVKVQSPDAVARGKMADPAALAGQAKGRPEAVDELAKAAAAEQERRDREKQEAEKAAARKAGLPTFRTGGPTAGTAAAHAEGPLAVVGERPGAVDPARAAADLDARTSKGAVFDQSADAPSDVPGASGALPRIAGSVGTGFDPKAETEKAVAAAAAQASATPGLGSLAGIADLLKNGGRPVERGQAQSKTDWTGTQAANASQAAKPLLLSPPAASLFLGQGTVIPAVLTRRVNSDMPGVITARALVNVYDSVSGRKLLIPMGAEFVGSYNSDVAFGQDRLQLAFTRMRMPDGSTFELPGATASDQAGNSGVTGDVNRHFFRTFGSALLLGVVADRVSKLQPQMAQTTQSQQQQISATGQVFVDVAKTELERMKSTPVTITIREGERINVEVVRDMAFPSVYAGRRY